MSSFAVPLYHFGGDLDDARIAIEENYSGCYSSLAGYAQEIAEALGDIPPRLESYIDYERLGRDMKLGGDVYIIETSFDEVHIFWAH